MDCRGGMPSPKNTQGSSKRKVRRQDGLTEYAAFFESLMGGPSNYARGASGNPKAPSLADNYMQLSHFHQFNSVIYETLESQDKWCRCCSVGSVACFAVILESVVSSQARLE
ncbi:hypothetical protein MRX96_012714 [Rhipicephalus microplus]